MDNNEFDKKFKDPIGIFVGALETFKAVAYGQIDRIRANALTTEIKGFVVDTTDTIDCGWETGIEPTGKKWIIVERYPDQTTANIGHTRWVKLLTENPDYELRDINYDYEDNDT